MGALTESDEGKRVIHGDETVGRVIAIEDGTPYVEPGPSITDTLLAKLGWPTSERYVPTSRGADRVRDRRRYPPQQESVISTDSF